MEEAVAKYGRIDYAANFAGVIGPSDPVSEMNVDEWQKTQDVNSKGILLATKYEMRQMIKQASIDGIHGLQVLFWRAWWCWLSGIAGHIRIVATTRNVAVGAFDIHHIVCQYWWRRWARTVDGSVVGWRTPAWMWLETSQSE